MALMLGAYLVLYRWLQRRWGRGAVITLLVITQLTVGYIIYSVTTYNSDGFYRDEYERITLRPFPESGKLSTHERTRTNSAAHPSHNQAWALLRVSPQEYQQLQKQLAQDARFSPYPCIVSQLHHGRRPFQLNLGDIYACGQYAYGYARRDQSQLLYIGFVTNGQYLAILSLDYGYIPSAPLTTP
ncbi:hypothetical protein [Hymenobacter metallilatus]|uniref:Uncharacterized protein n=1 Tax=Hymenobacter metallilatus TaxID=2493666 RepID=A0A428JRZ8_9BACT|nr:hypothetical protein [Hymenobacter metallilatus]RSK36267.1 hypothetical protein EI290_05120 [Hymenobacter metallilatus]